MKRILILWLAIAAVYAGFLAWHTNLRGPLSVQEVDAKLELYSSRNDPETINAPGGLRDFLINDDGRAFFIVNLNSFLELADYPEDTGEGVSGAEADERYSAVVLPALFKRGGYPVLLSFRLATLDDTSQSDLGQFERLGVVRYRSRRDLLNMITSEEFAAGAVHKWASLEQNLVAPTRPGFVITLGLLVPLVLALAGSLLTIALMATRRPKHPAAGS